MMRLLRERFAGLCPDEPEPLSAAIRLLDTDAVGAPDDIAAPMILIAQFPLNAFLAFCLIKS